MEKKDETWEAHLARSACVDSCREQGEKQRLERETKLKELSDGLLVKASTIKKALEEKEQKEKELSRVQAELPDLEARLGELRRKKERDLLEDLSDFIFTYMNEI